MDEPVRGSWLRRRWLALVAVLIAVVVLIGLSWVVMVRQFDDEMSDSKTLPFDCSKDHAEVVQQVESFRPIPDDDEFADVSAALADYLEQDRWTLESWASDPGTEPELLATMSADGDSYEFLRSDGSRGLITPDTVLTSAPDSSMWVGVCPNNGFMPFGLGGPTGCYAREESGDTVTIRYRRLSTSTPGCDPEVGITFEVTTTKGEFERFAYTLTTESGASVTELRAAAAKDVADPWPWQVIPGWFAEMVVG